jgi:uncharacterized protein (DUF2236 family)
MRTQHGADVPVTGAGRTEVLDPHAAPDIAPEVRLLMSGLGMAAAAANVVMQLSRLPIGRGVAESRVESGRADKHPAKRTRTTLSYLVIALYGTEHERAVMRKEVNKSHRQVRSLPTDEVAYNAFDPELQLWVAACLYKGVEDILTLFYGIDDDAVLDTVYRHGARLATTLQVPEERWPADRTAFEAYWADGVAQVHMDDVTRPFLLDLVNLKVMPGPLRWAMAPLHRFITTGFLPPRFREELGLPWDDRRQRIFDRGAKIVGAVHQRLPRVIREHPFNMYLWDARRRIRRGRAIV